MGTVITLMARGKCAALVDFSPKEYEVCNRGRFSGVEQACVRGYAKHQGKILVPFREKTEHSSVTSYSEFNTFL